jgi:hypothetical protein
VFNQQLFGSFQRVKELWVGLGSAIMVMENSRAELKKLVAYVTPDVFVDEIVWRMLDIDTTLETILG